MVKTKKKWGFLAPTREKAEEMEKKYGVHFTPLIDYMKVIFPDIDDWEEGKEIDLKGDICIKTDLYSPKGKKIIKLYFKHTKLDFNRRDVVKCGYDAYIFADSRQLTNATVKHIFGVNVTEHLFDENVPTLTQPWINYPKGHFFVKSHWQKVKSIYNGDTKQYHTNIDAIMNQKSSGTLDKIIVEKLFNLYTYEINLYANNNISILIGPNGCGKTTLLKIISFMLCGFADVKEINKIPFQSIICILSNGKKIKLTHSKDNKELYIFINDKKIISFNEQDDDKKNDKKCIIYRDLLREKSCLIVTFFQGTSRLLMKTRYEEEKDDDGKTIQKFYDTISELRNHFKSFCESLVLYYEAEKSDREHDLLDQYINTSMENKEKLLSDKKFEKEWMEFSKKREEYEQNQAFYLQWYRNSNEASEDTQIIGQYKQGNKREFLCTYLRLFKETLPELEKAHKRMMLFQRIINERFKFTKKQLHYRYQEMYLTIGEGREKKEIDFEKLSSGEKHTFIMFFNLIFASSDVLVLIDEPEISLHIEWQERFIKDLSEICKMNNIQALVATHSPNIINEHTDLIAKWEVKDEQ